MAKEHTVICGVFETSVSNEGDSGMEAFGIPQAFHDHVHFLAS